MRAFGALAIGIVAGLPTPSAATPWSSGSIPAAVTGRRPVCQTDSHSSGRFSTPVTMRSAAVLAIRLRPLRRAPERAEHAVTLKFGWIAILVGSLLTSDAAAQTISVSTPFVAFSEIVGGSNPPAEVGSITSTGATSLSRQISNANQVAHWPSGSQQNGGSPGDGQIGRIVGRGTPAATAEGIHCSGEVNVTASSVSGRYARTGVGAYDPSTGKSGHRDPLYRQILEAATKRPVSRRLSTGWRYSACWHARKAQRHDDDRMPSATLSITRLGAGLGSAAAGR